MKTRHNAFLSRARHGRYPQRSGVARARRRPAACARRAVPHRLAGEPRSAPRAPDAAGFIQRWLILEPIRVAPQLTDSAVQAVVKKEYFPDQFTVMPHDGDTVTVGDESLTWHAVDTIDYNVNLFHFAYALNKPTSNVLFWAVTVVDAPRDMPGVRLAIGSNAASVWWLNGAGSDRHLQRSADGDRRRRLEAADAEERTERDPRRNRERRRSDGLLRAISRRRRQSRQRDRRETGRERKRGAAVSAPSASW